MIKLLRKLVSLVAHDSTPLKKQEWPLFDWSQWDRWPTAMAKRGTEGHRLIKNANNALPTPLSAPEVCNHKTESEAEACREAHNAEAMEGIDGSAPEGKEKA